MLVCAGGCALCAFGYSAFMQPLFAQPSVWNTSMYQSSMTGQTNSSPIDERQRGICPLYSQERKKKGVEGAGAKESCQRVYYTVSKQRACCTMALLMAQCQGAAGQ